MTTYNKTQRFILSAPQGEIEVQLDYPKTPCLLRTVALVCHPHPLHGGTLDNKVSYMLASTLKRLGVITLRFNFRGVGNSSGVFDNAEGETEDAVWLAEWLQSTFSAQHFWLAGFSFGASVAIKAHVRLRPERLILVAPPLHWFGLEFVRLNDAPTLIIQGAKDEVVDPNDVKEWVNQQTAATQLSWHTEADHFFNGQLPALRGSLETWLSESV